MWQKGHDNQKYAIPLTFDVLNLFAPNNSAFYCVCLIKKSFSFHLIRFQCQVTPQVYIINKKNITLIFWSQLKIKYEVALYKKMWPAMKDLFKWSQFYLSLAKYIIK